MSEHIGTDYCLINSDRFIQQNRPRFYWTNEKIDLTKLPERPKWDGKYFHLRRSYWRELKNGVSPCLTVSDCNEIYVESDTLNYTPLGDIKRRKLTPNECGLLQGLPNNYTEGVSNTQQYKMIGNGFTVPVIAWILKQMKVRNYENTI